MHHSNQCSCACQCFICTISIGNHYDQFFSQATEAKQQRDEALNHVQLLTDKLEQVNGSIGNSKDLRGLSIQKLKSLQVNYWLDSSLSSFVQNHQFSFHFSKFRQNCALIWRKLKRYYIWKRQQSVWNVKRTTARWHFHAIILCCVTYARKLYVSVHTAKH